MIRKRKTKSITAGAPTTRPTRAILAALGIVIAVGLGVTAQTQAATITVNEDGSGNYTDIPAALAAAASGDTIEVAEGTYTGVEIFKPAIRIHGQGTGTRITTGAGPWNDGFVIYADDVEIGNMAIEIVGAFAAGVFVPAGTNVTVEGMEVTVAADQYGILVRPITGLWPKNTRIERNTITTKAGDLGWSGIECYASVAPVVTGNEISGAYGWQGIALVSSDAANASGNAISGTSNNAIYLRESANSAVAGNAISGDYRSQVVVVRTSPDVVVMDNEIAAVSKEDNAIRIMDSDEAVVSGNRVSGTYNNTIRVVASPYANVKDNMISGVARERGIRVNKSSFVGVEGNTFSGTCKRAIQLDNCSDSDVTGNTISGNGRVGIGLDRSPYSNVINNMISGVGERRGIFVDQSDSVGVEGNTIKNIRTGTDWAAPIIVERSSDCTVARNTLIDVYDPQNYAKGNGPIAGIRISGDGTWDMPCARNMILENDYSQSGLPGFATYVNGELVETGEPGCILLEAGWWKDRYGETTDNHVIQSLSPTGTIFPIGTNLCTQLVDLTDDPGTPAYDGKNHISGYAACVNNPNWGSILRHLQETLPKNSDEEVEAEDQDEEEEPLPPPPVRGH